MFFLPYILWVTMNPTKESPGFMGPWTGQSPNQNTGQQGSNFTITWGPQHKGSVALNLPQLGPRKCLRWPKPEETSPSHTAKRKQLGSIYDKLGRNPTGYPMAPKCSTKSHKTWLFIIPKSILRVEWPNQQPKPVKEPDPLQSEPEGGKVW